MISAPPGVDRPGVGESDKSSDLYDEKNKVLRRTKFFDTPGVEVFSVLPSWEYPVCIEVLRYTGGRRFPRVGIAGKSGMCCRFSTFREPEIFPPGNSPPSRPSVKKSRDPRARAPGKPAPADPPGHGSTGPRFSTGNWSIPADFSHTYRPVHAKRSPFHALLKTRDRFFAHSGRNLVQDRTIGSRNGPGWDPAPRPLAGSAPPGRPHGSAILAVSRERLSPMNGNSSGDHGSSG